MLDDFSSMAWHARRNSVSMIIITNYYPEKRQQLFCKEILMYVWCGDVFYILFFLLYQTGSIKGAPLANIFYTQVYLWRKYEMEWRKKLLVLNFLPHNNLKLSWSSLILNLLLTWLFCDVMSYYHYHLYNHFNHNTQLCEDCFFFIKPPFYST